MQPAPHPASTRSCPACSRSSDRITIVVTRRLENTRIAHHIIVMDHGRITEQDRYDDLIHAGGSFAELLHLSQDR
ncbi:hypothetical protein [Streptomyces sp. NPDC096934]|uniref:hypothetical protein n=1 Tax=Streptomyces sp. NPDC096934 TaxID=3155551 RepID=UPI00332537AC